MNNIFKGIKIGDEVFSYYYQIWGKTVKRGANDFLVSYILDTGEEVRHRYAYDGSCWLSDHRTQEVFTGKIPPLPADDLSNLRVGDKVFVQPYQKWAEVTKVLPAGACIVIKIPRDRLKDEYVMVTITGLLGVNHKAPSVFLEEVPQPSGIQTVLTGLYEFL